MSEHFVRTFAIVIGRPSSKNTKRMRQIRISHTETCVLCVCVCYVCVVCVCVFPQERKRKRKINNEEKYSSKYCYLDRPAYHRYGLLETLICKCTLMDIYATYESSIEQKRIYLLVIIFLEFDHAKIELRFSYHHIVSCNKILLKWKENGNTIQWNFRGKE